MDIVRIMAADAHGLLYAHVSVYEKSTRKGFNFKLFGDVISSMFVSDKCSTCNMLPRQTCAFRVGYAVMFSQYTFCHELSVFAL